MTDIEVLGVHPVGETQAPCHLLEVEVRDLTESLDLAALRQPDPALPEDEWQAPYDEVLLDREGRPTKERVPLRLGPGNVRLAFFLHDLDLARPLQSPFGDIRLPPATPRPVRLEGVRYVAPD